MNNNKLQTFIIIIHKIHRGTSSLKVPKLTKIPCLINPSQGYKCLAQGHTTEKSSVNPSRTADQLLVIRVYPLDHWVQKPSIKKPRQKNTKVTVFQNSRFLIEKFPLIPMMRFHYSSFFLSRDIVSECGSKISIGEITF